MEQHGWSGPADLMDDGDADITIDWYLGSLTVRHLMPAPRDERPAFGRGLDQCAECGDLVQIPHVATCARGDLCTVCSAECKSAHEETHGYGACNACSDTECRPHQIESAALFGARAGIAETDRLTTLNARSESTYQEEPEHRHCAWNSCSRLFIPADRRYTYCGHPDCPATRVVPEHAQPSGTDIRA
jgi:hypothetical protein